MAPPVVRGRAAAKQRLVGLLFLAVLAGLVGLTIAQYQKAFTPTVDVTLLADRAGNQLGTGGDVKARGVVVGEIRSITPTDDGARIDLALERDEIGRIPADTRARLLPKTLFGEKEVSLVFEDRPGAEPISDGDVITQDRSETAREFSSALDGLLPLLQTLKPEQVSTTLNALSTTLRGRGDRVGSNLVLFRDYLREINPEIPALGEDFSGLADFADTLDAAAPDVLQVLDDLAVINQDLVESEDAMAQFLQSTTGVAGTAEGFVAENEQRFIGLARESVPNLSLFAEFSPEYPCLADGLVRASADIANTFGALQPGLHITLEFIEQRNQYVTGDEPEYLERVLGPTCRGLVGPPEVPFPEYANGDDGYRDGQDIDGRTGELSGEEPDGPEGPYTYRDQRRKGPPGPSGDDAPRTTRIDEETSASASATPFSPASYDRLAVGLVVAPALGVRPDEVPDVAVLLFGPVARGTVVTPA